MKCEREGIIIVFLQCNDKNRRKNRECCDEQEQEDQHAHHDGGAKSRYSTSSDRTELPRAGLDEEEHNLGFGNHDACFRWSLLLLLDFLDSQIKTIKTRNMD